ncbi:MAG: glycosyltransferase [Sphingobacteriaceae bacterium]|nr:glycosyltransferase [Sphingobacteriaceae bacterium]
MASHFDSVTLLITHYNRSSSLEHLLKSYRALGCSFGDIVVSDDGSKPEHLSRLNELKEEYSFNLITTPENRGLGNNINKGQDAVKTSYTLYVQEDFEPAADFALHFGNALNMMDEKEELDIVRFYSYLKYPYLRPYKNGFSEMLIKPWGFNYKKIYYYSDHPHLRRTSFFEKFGRYPEGLKGDRTEYLMCVSFIRNKGKGLFFDDYKALFYQKNSEAEPSTMTYRSKWTQSNNFFISMVRDLYRQLKYNYDLNR